MDPSPHTPGPLFSGSFLCLGRSRHIQISSQCICAGHGKSGARGSCGQLWVQPRAVGRSPAKSCTLPLAKRKRVCLFFFNVSFLETKRIRPSHTEASVRPAHLKTLYIQPLSWLLPLALAALRTIKRATECHLNLCFCLKDKHASWLISRARSDMAVSGKLPNGTRVLFTPLVSSTELMKSLVACREHRHSGSSLIPSVQEALSAPTTGGCQYS